MKNIAFTLPAVFAVIACSIACSRVSNVTSIYGTIDSDAIDEVNVIIKDMEVDTLVPVADGRFRVEVPAGAASIGTIEAAGYKVTFIPDGTRLEVVLGEESSVKSSSSRSIQNRLNEYFLKSEQIQNDFRAKVTEITNDTGLQEDEMDAALDSNYNATISSFIDFNLSVISDNRDNFISVIALDNIASLTEAGQIDSLIGTLSEKVRETDYVNSLLESARRKMETAEGRMFKDFTVEDSDGRTVSLSDYVGKGKYVLVDFWASWCGPCQAEIPNLKSVYDDYRKKGLEIVSVAVWDKPADTRKAAAAHGLKWPQIINAQTEPAQIYGIEGIPHIILFGPDGTILKRDLRGEEIRNAVASFLGE